VGEKRKPSSEKTVDMFRRMPGNEKRIGDPNRGKEGLTDTKSIIRKKVAQTNTTGGHRKKKKKKRLGSARRREMHMSKGSRLVLDGGQRLEGFTYH